MSANIFVDTNILVYCRDTSKPEKQEGAAEWVGFLWQSGVGRLSIQVITEFYAVVTGKLKPGMDAVSAREDMRDLFSWNPLPLTADLIVVAWGVQDQYRLSWWDSLIVAAAWHQQCTILLSEDFQHNQDFQGLRVINPFLIKPNEITL